MLPSIVVDLDRPPSSRWAHVAHHSTYARRLVATYVRDLGGAALFEGILDDYRAGFVDPEYAAEIDAVADAIAEPRSTVLLANLYYDAMKTVLMGCTAFAVDSPEGPVHARNLDWWTEERLLSELTQVIELRGGRSVGPCKLVGWPGFVGAFSGLAPGRFAVTLNAVISEDPVAVAAPITFLIRTALETCRTFDEAVALLRDTPIASDCLLLVTGSRQGEMVVIERTPTRAALRFAEDGVLVVTNDYRALDGASAAPAETELQRTACTRFERALALARGARPLDPAACFAVLTDPAVRMDITVQQMVMRASTGELAVRAPA